MIVSVLFVSKGGDMVSEEDYLATPTSEVVPKSSIELTEDL